MSFQEKYKELQKLFKSRSNKLKTYVHDESKFENKCTDAVMYTEEKIGEEMKNNDTILFFMEQTNTVYCMDINDLYGSVKNKRTNIFFKCNKKDKLSDLDYENPYFKISFGMIQGLVSLDNIRSLLLSENRVFYILPKVDKNNKQIKIKYTISWANAMTKDVDYVSAKHCQEGSDYSLYEIRICNSESNDSNCLVTALSKKKIDTVFVRYITDVLTPSSSDIKDVIDTIDDRYKEQIKETEESVYLTHEEKETRINNIKIRWNIDRNKKIRKLQKQLKLERKLGDESKVEEIVKNYENDGSDTDIICTYDDGRRIGYKNDNIPNSLKKVIKIKVLTEFTIKETMKFKEIRKISGPGKVKLVGDMSSMFQDATNFNSDLSKWKVDNVTNMSSMFQDATNFNSDLSKWKVENVTDMSSMFKGATNFNSDLSKWKVNNVTNMSTMFAEAENFNSDLSKWKVNNVTDMSSMFVEAIKFNSDISKWKVNNVTNMSTMFAEATNFTSDLSKWKVNNVTDMSNMFWNATIFISDLSKWKVDNVTNMSSMFSNAINFNSDISKWKVNNVTDMSRMFRGATNFNGDLSKWNVKNVTNMGGMFQGATNFNSDLSKWKVDNVTNMINMFYNTKTFNSDLSEWKVDNVTNMAAMFANAINFNSDLSKWKVNNVTDMSNMFYNTKTFNSDISKWNVENVTNMGGMFQGATNFNSDLSKWKVDNVTNMINMFRGATNLSELPSWYSKFDSDSNDSESDSSESDSSESDSSESDSSESGYSIFRLD